MSDRPSKQDLLASLRDYGTVAGKRMTVQDRACHAAADEIDRLTREVAMWSQVWDNVKVDNPDLRADNKPLAVAATYALLTARNAELVKALERLAQRRDRHHDCGDYERGYGDAEASASAIARAALKEPTT